MDASELRAGILQKFLIGRACLDPSAFPGVDWPVAHAAWATRSWLLCYGHQAGASEKRLPAGAYVATLNSTP